MTVTVRTITCDVTFASVDISANVLEARGQESVDGGWPQCSVFVPGKPASGNEGDTLSVVAGAGNNPTRFSGPVFRFKSSAFPRGIEIVAQGTLARAADWAPSEDIIFDDIFPEGATGSQIVSHALDQVPGISYSGGNIGDTGTVLGLESPEAFDWKAGVTAWNRIQELDRAELYRTYQTQGGTIKRIRLIGHPNTSANFTLAPEDLLDGSQGTRDTNRTRNFVRVQGHDYGDGLGAVTNGTGSSGSNGIQGDGGDPATRYTQTFSSGFIESGTDLFDDTWDERNGLRADELGSIILNDVNKEFVEAEIDSWRDDTHGPGLTCLLDCLDLLAIGEKMYVEEYSWRVSDSGWTTHYKLSGGGLEQSYSTPDV